MASSIRDKYGVYSSVPALVPKHQTASNTRNTKIDKDSENFFNVTYGNNISSIRVIPLTQSTTVQSRYLNNIQAGADSGIEKVVFNYIGFLLTNVRESHEEKVSVVSLPGDTYATFFYGAQPRSISFTGLVFNTESDNWRDSFELLYEQYVRGTAATRNNTIVQIKYEDRIVTGYITSMEQTLGAENTAIVQFTINMLVKDITMLSVKDVDSELMNKSYKESLNDAIGQSNLKLLSNDRLKFLRNYVRTSTIAPPPKPPVPKKSGASTIKDKNCFITSNGEVTAIGLTDQHCSAGDIVRSALARKANAQAAVQTLLKEASLNPSKKVDEAALSKAKAAVEAATTELNELQDPDNTRGKALVETFNKDVDNVKSKFNTEARKGQSVLVGDSGAVISFDGSGNVSNSGPQNIATNLINTIQSKEKTLSDSQLKTNSANIKQTEDTINKQREAAAKKRVSDSIRLETSNEKKTNASVYKD